MFNKAFSKLTRTLSGLFSQDSFSEDQERRDSQDSQDSVMSLDPLM